MADRYLLESGAPDGYLLEDASGVLLLEAAATPVSDAGKNETSNLVQTPNIQGGYSTVPNLLLTTLAVFAAGSQLVKREATVHNPKPAPAVQVFQVPNLLTSTLGVQVIPIPPGKQQLSSAPATPQVYSWQPDQNPLLFKLPLPVGQDRTESAPPSVAIGAAQQTQSRLLLEQIVQPIPIGRQQTESAPRTPPVLFWDRGSNTLIFTTPPSGKQETDSAPPSQPINTAQEIQSRALLDFTVQPLPQGQQETANLIQTPDVLVFTPPQIIPPVVAANPLPIGKQETDSAPATPRIGDIKFARGVDPGPPAAAAPLPPGEQRTDNLVWKHSVDSFRHPVIVPPVVAAQTLPPGESNFLPVPYRQERPQIDQPANLLGSAIGLQPIASANIEWSQKIAPPDVFLWLPENVTIRLPVVANPIPVGEQSTDSAPIVNPAVYVFTPPQIIPPIVQAIPPGHQQTDSAPIPVPGVQSFTAPVIIPPIVVPIPPGQQRTESAPIPAPDVWAFNAPIIIPPIAQPLPIGQQHTDSAPIWVVPIGTSVGWTIPPDLLPPGVDHPPIVSTDQVTGGWPMYYGKRIRKHRPIEVTEIVTIERVQKDIQESKSRLEQKRELRRTERRSRYLTEQIRSILDEQDRMKLSIEALKLELIQKGLNDDDIALILALAS